MNPRSTRRCVLASSIAGRRPADVLAGLQKSALEWRRRRRICPVLRPPAPRARLRLQLASASSRACRAPRPPSPRSAASPARALPPRRCPQQHDRVALGRAVPQREDREPPHRLVAVGVQRGWCRSGRTELTSAGWSRESSSIESERRAAAGRAVVLEPAPQQLLLLAQAELADRAVGAPRARGSRRPRRRASSSSAHAAAQLGELALVAALGERVRLDAGLGEAQVRTGVTSTSDAVRVRRPDVPGRRPEEPARALLLEDVRRPAGDARAGEHRGRERRRDLARRRARPPSSTRRSSPARARDARSCSCRERGLLELLGDLDLRRAELLRGPLEDARARVLGPVDRWPKPIIRLPDSSVSLHPLLGIAELLRPRRASASRTPARRRAAARRARRPPTRAPRRSRRRSRRRRAR